MDLTAPSSPGTYYYGACVDAVPNESDTTNNCASVPVTVSEPEQRAPSVKIGVEDDKEWAPVGDTVDLSARVLDDEGEEVAGTSQDDDSLRSHRHDQPRPHGLWSLDNSRSP